MLHRAVFQSAAVFFFFISCLKANSFITSQGVVRYESSFKILDHREQQFSADLCQSQDVLHTTRWGQ